jgi:hypothetical protein
MNDSFNRKPKDAAEKVDRYGTALARQGRGGFWLLKRLVGLDGRAR